MRRNFDNESIANFLLRFLRAFAGRTRGLTLFSLGFFAKGSSRSLYIGNGFRFINSKGIKFGTNVGLGIMTRLECHSKQNKSNILEPVITFGNKTSFGDYLHIGAMNGVNIGSNVLGGSNILIIDHNHGHPSVDMKTKSNTAPRDRLLHSKGKIIIEDNVWIGDNCIILPGSHIGFGAIISANSVVDGYVSSHTIHLRGK